MSEHLPDEALSDAVDGRSDATTEAHLASCADCRAQLDGLHAVAAVVAVPPPAPPAAQRERAVRTALAGPPARARLPVPPWMGAAAAVLVVLAVAGAILAGRDGGGGDAQTALSEATRDDSAAFDTRGFLDGGDLGDQSDPAALHALLEAQVTGSADAAALSSGPGGDEGRGGTSQAGDVTPPEAPASVGAKSTPPSLVCIAEAQAAGSNRLGLLVYGARLRWQGQPAVVLVFAGADQAALGRRAFVMARRDCQLLVAQSF